MRHFIPQMFETRSYTFITFRDGRGVSRGSCDVQPQLLRHRAPLRNVSGHRACVPVKEMTACRWRRAHKVNEPAFLLPFSDGGKRRRRESRRRRADGGSGFRKENMHLFSCWDISCRHLCTDTIRLWWRTLWCYWTKLIWSIPKYIAGQN